MDNTFRFLRRSFLIPASLAVWVFTMISLPILGWTLGEDALVRGMSVGVLVQAAAVAFILYEAWGIQKLVVVLIPLTVLSFFAEFAGTRTGFPFGQYRYTLLLQPQVGGVPLLIPLAWMMMLPPAWAMGQIITAKAGRAFSFVVVSALAFTAWDLFLDPQMVAWDFWRWQTTGAYFGIPLVNYAGWLGVSAVLTFVLAPQKLPLVPLSMVYGLTWILQTIGQGIFWHQPGPALCGFLGCGLFVLLAFYRRNAVQAHI